MALLFAGCGGDNNSSPPKPTATPTPTINVSLWVANGTNVLEFAPSQLLIQGATSPVPQLTLTSPAFGAPQGVTFDAAGDLWVIDGGNIAAGGTIAPALEEFTPAQLSAFAVPGPPSNGPSAGPTPNVTINSPELFIFPQQAVFDSSGDLWVSDSRIDAVFEFTPAQLAVSGSVLPKGLLVSNPSFSGPVGLAFDSSGNLWVANNKTTTIFEFNAAALAAVPRPSPASITQPTLTPNIVLADDGNGSIQGPWALAFDSAGNLWSSNASAPFTIVEFAKSSLIPLPPFLNASVVPAVTIDPTQAAGLPSLNSPNGIAFDNLGDLTAANSLAPFSIALFQNPQLIQPSARFDAHYVNLNPNGVPNVFFSGAATALNAPAGVTFGPVH